MLRASFASCASCACLLAALVATSCATFGATLPAGAAGGSFLDEPKGAVPFAGAGADAQRALDAAARSHVDANVDVLMALCSESADLRAAVRSAEHDVHAHYEKAGAVDQADVARIRDVARRYLELDALLYALWTTYRASLPYSSEPDPYAPMRAANLLSSSTRDVGGLLALSAELVRLENAAVVVDVLGPHLAITRFLNRGDKKLALPAEGFDRCVGALTDPDHRGLLERQLRALASQRQRLDAQAQLDPRIAFLLGVVDESPLAKAIVDEGDFHRRMVFLWNVTARSSIDLFGPALDVFIEHGYVNDDPNADDDANAHANQHESDRK